MPRRRGRRPAARASPDSWSGDGWPARLLEQLGALHLLIEAHRRLDELPPELAATVRSRVGYPISKADVLAGPGLQDHWYAVGAVDSREGRLDTPAGLAVRGRPAGAGRCC